MPPSEIILILALLAVAGNIIAFWQKFAPPSPYYLLLALGCFVVAGLYLYLINNPDATIQQRAYVVRWGYVILFTPMTYPLIYYGVKGIMKWKQ